MVGLLSDGELLMFDTPQNLRRAAFDGEVIDVEVRQHATAEQIARLRDAPSVIGDIERVDAVTWRIVVRDADEALADMSERLDAVGLELVEATEHVVDYDEAFVRVVERHRNALAEVAS
jgi:ABC-2 type transport system ATP-binding protein